MYHGNWALDKAIKLLPETDKKDFNPASYIMITGDKKLSPNNKNELKMAIKELPASAEPKQVPIY